MKKLLIILTISLFACEPVYFEPELIEGQCYIFEPPQEFINPSVDTIWIVSREKDYVLVENNKLNRFKMKYENFGMYLRITPLCNCKYGNN